MRLEMLPSLENEAIMAYVNENNEVIWTYPNLGKKSEIYEMMMGTEYAQFLVWRRGETVCVEACAWYGPEFHFRVEITLPNPEHVVILAANMAHEMDTAFE